MRTSSAITYKQALRGLFVTGTSVIRFSRYQREVDIRKSEYRSFDAAKGRPLLKLRRVKEKVG